MHESPHTTHEYSCVVCGDSIWRNLNYCHIISKVEDDAALTLYVMNYCFTISRLIIGTSSCKECGAMNKLWGTCLYNLFDKYFYYIRWVLEVVFYNLWSPAFSYPTVLGRLCFNQPFSSEGYGSLSWQSDKPPCKRWSITISRCISFPRHAT